MPSSAGARCKEERGGPGREDGRGEGDDRRSPLYADDWAVNESLFFPLQTEKMQTTGALLISPALVSCGSGVICSDRCGTCRHVMNDLREAWHPDVVGLLGGRV